MLNEILGEFFFIYMIEVIRFYFALKGQSSKCHMQVNILCIKYTVHIFHITNDNLKMKNPFASETA